MQKSVDGRGFTLIELMIALLIIGILVSIVVPAYQSYVIRTQIAEGITMAEAVKTAVVDAYTTSGSAPADRQVAGLSADPTDTQSKYVASVDIDKGVVTVTFGNASSAAIENRTLSLTPYETVDHGVVWRCGHAPEPQGLEELGTAGGATVAEHIPPTVPTQYLAQPCR